jgi:FixJ family two-component response regulator/glycine cleavage system H lipoate-binding protein
MTALLMVLLFAGFIGVDVVVRAVSKRMEAARARRQREAVLRTTVQLGFASEVTSLRRAEVPNAKARILAVDDEAVVLDSFRKILVLQGFSVDTVQSGAEALTVLRDHAYEFVFTDLKMPGMDGVEVVKSVKHLRPDVDVAVITGFGTIETAVETMGYGAADYVQKPFTEDELVAFAERLLVKRQARLEAQRRPTVRVVAPEVAESVASREYCVPGGAFVAPGHAWAQIETTGEALVGLDDFGRKLVDRIERIELPAPGTIVKRGDVLFLLRRGSERLRVRSPLGGVVETINTQLQHDPKLLLQSPYDRGWVCVLRPSDLAGELPGLRIGKPVVSWYHEEVARMRRELPAGDGASASWSEMEGRFFGGGVAPSVKVTEAAGVTV